MLGEIENSIEKFKIALNNNDKQFFYLEKLLKAAKKRISKSSERNQTIKRIYNNR